MVFEPVSKRHDRSTFDCGVESVNRYLRESARQQSDRRLTLTTVLVETAGSSEVLGYHTLVMSTVLCAHIPAKGLPFHQQAPVVLLAQFGVSLKFQGRGLGKRLLYDALARALLASQQVGCMGVVLDAVDAKARGFYVARGFCEMTDDPFHLWMPISVIEDIFPPQDTVDQDRT
jgi:GNAT superfamily N-acetyltransferase